MGRQTTDTGLEEDQSADFRVRRETGPRLISPFVATFSMLLIVAVVVTCAGCQNTYLDMSAGPEVQPIFRGGSNWEGSGPIVEVALRKYWDAWFCQYAHTSNLGSGPPFNGDTETTLDRVTCGRSFRIR